MIKLSNYTSMINKKNIVGALLAFSCLIIFSACEQESTDKQQESTKEPSKNWIEEQPSNEMRFRQYYLAEHPNIKLTVFKFPPGSNSIEGNFDRWKKQFTSLESKETIDISENRKGIILKGTFKQKPFPMAQDFKEVENTMMLAAIIKKTDGDYFYKVTGDKNILSSEKEGFINMISAE